MARYDEPYFNRLINTRILARRECDFLVGKTAFTDGSKFADKVKGGKSKKFLLLVSRLVRKKYDY